MLRRRNCGRATLRVQEEGVPWAGELPTTATDSDTGATGLSPCSKPGDLSSPSDEGKLPRQEVNVLDSPPTGISSFLLVFAIL